MANTRRQKHRVRIRFGAAHNDITTYGETPGSRLQFELPAPPEPRRHGHQERSRRMRILSDAAAAVCSALGIVDRKAVGEVKHREGDGGSRKPASSRPAKSKGKPRRYVPGRKAA